MRVPEWEGPCRLKLAGAVLLSIALHAVAVPAWLESRLPPQVLREPPLTAMLAALTRPPAAAPTPVAQTSTAPPATRAAQPQRARKPLPPAPDPGVHAVPREESVPDWTPSSAAVPASESETASLPPAAAHAGTAATSDPASVGTSAPNFDALYLHNPPPAYPILSRRLREQGRVLLRVLVSAEGRAEEVEIRASSGFGRLDAAARDAVARWRFAPARRGDAPAAAWVLIPISFSLEG